MARSISDVLIRKDNSKGNQPRRARLVDAVADEGDDGPSLAVTTPAGEAHRRASFRPAEDVAVRRDVAEAFGEAMLRDVRVADADPDSVLDAVRAAAAVDDWEAAFERLREFEQSDGKRNWEVARLGRRVLRQIGADGPLFSNLAEAASLDGAPEWSGVYTGLECAWRRWLKGGDAAEIRRQCREALARRGDGPEIDGFAAVWAMQMRCDAALEGSDPDRAFAALEDVIERPELIVEIRQALQARRAVWMHVYGRHHESKRLLDELAKRGALPGDLDDLLVSLCFEASEPLKAFDVLRSIAGDRCRLREHAVPLVMLHATAAENPATGRDVLAEATELRDDATLLKLREDFLDAAARNTAGGADAELIEVLNRRLEGELSVDQRVNALTRLGRLYEVEAGLEEAAAEVYREALSYDPQHVPALRALGRLYTRRDNWTGLVELYEREIATLDESEISWRRHFQLAEIYEHRLERHERALENYLVVLERRPNYLPALKSSARILERLQRWTRLADLFLRMVDTAPSRRQKLYLLDKVAEVAEDRLENYDVAIGAWREILELEPESPRAFAALGRLYAKTQRWEELIALNEREIELIDDAEEVAASWLRNAEIAERHLEDLEAAEHFYRRALDVIPDYLPALEALGRIYQRGGRWSDIVEMTGRELKSGGHHEDGSRQLGALAEILETRLDRRSEAITIYEGLWPHDPNDAHVFASLSRLYRAEERWVDLERILKTRLERDVDPREAAELWGELAVVAEWRLEAPQIAYRRYLEALEAAPTNTHWLGGVARTWPAADADAREVAERLENLLMNVTDVDARDRYFEVIARLRERSEGGPEASRAYRAHGEASSLENQIVLRLAMAAAGERGELNEARRANPHHPLEDIIGIERTATDEKTVERLVAEAGRLSGPAKKWFLQELPPQTARHLGDPGGLYRDLTELSEGEALHHQEAVDPETAARCRLRALQARLTGEYGRYLEWTNRELKHLSVSTAAVRRLEMAELADRKRPGRADELYRRACREVFPEIGDDEAVDEQFDAAQDISTRHIEDLYDALCESDRWELLRDCLEAQVSRPEIDDERRLALFERLADVLRRRLDDYDGARDALTHCWQLSEDPRFLREIATYARDRDKTEDALRFQRRHFERLSMSSEATAAQRVQSGIWLAELLLAVGDDDHRAMAIDRLEHLVETYDEVERLDTAHRMLARAHADAQNGRRAVELFDGVLHFQIRADELDDWRRLVDVCRRQIGDLHEAYTRQWRIVRAFPDSKRDLDTLVDLAAEAGEMSDCIDQLAELASTAADDQKVHLLARAAEAADEELGRAEEAFRLFDRVVDYAEDFDQDDERRRYYERRRAVCLARMAGREARALDAFRGLIEREPFEPANYRGMETLFDRANAHDRLRIARQTLAMLGCETKDAEPSGKVHPTRSLDDNSVDDRLLSDELTGGVLNVLRSSKPLIEKVFSGQLPQRKALEGRRVTSEREIDFYADLQAALIAFGYGKFKLYVGESGPQRPQVFAGGTPVVWVNELLIEELTSAKSRFLAGWCAALIWSGVPELLSLEGRRVWHLVEAVWSRETEEGFRGSPGELTRQLVGEVSSPFDIKNRRAVVGAVERCECDFAQVDPGKWSRQLERFAARAGLLMSGDLSEAAAGLLRLDGWGNTGDAESLRERFEESELVGDLVRLAHSEDYLELRYQIGLAGRPSRLEL